MAVTELKVLDCEFTEAVLAMFTPASCPQYGKAHLVDVRLSGNYMEVVRLRVKAAMLSFQHSSHRHGHISVLSPPDLPLPKRGYFLRAIAANVLFLK